MRLRVSSVRCWKHVCVVRDFLMGREGWGDVESQVGDDRTMCGLNARTACLNGASCSSTRLACLLVKDRAREGLSACLVCRLAGWLRCSSWNRREDRKRANRMAVAYACSVLLYDSLYSESIKTFSREVVVMGRWGGVFLRMKMGQRGLAGRREMRRGMGSLEWEYSVDTRVSE